MKTFTEKIDLKKTSGDKFDLISVFATIKNPSNNNILLNIVRRKLLLSRIVVSILFFHQILLVEKAVINEKVIVRSGLLEEQS